MAAVGAIPLAAPTLLGSLAGPLFAFLGASASGAAVASMCPLRNSGKLKLVLKETKAIEVEPDHLNEMCLDEKVHLIQYCDGLKEKTFRHDFILLKTESGTWFKFEKAWDAIWISKLSHRLALVPEDFQVLQEYSTTKTLHDCFDHVDQQEFGKKFILARNNCKHFADRLFKFCTSGCIRYKPAQHQQREVEGNTFRELLPNLNISGLQLIRKKKRHCLLLLCEQNEAFEFERNEDAIFISKVEYILHKKVEREEVRHRNLQDVLDWMFAEHHGREYSVETFNAKNFAEGMRNKLLN